MQAERGSREVEKEEFMYNKPSHGYESLKTLIQTERCIAKPATTSSNNNNGDGAMKGMVDENYAKHSIKFIVCIRLQ